MKGIIFFGDNLDTIEAISLWFKFLSQPGAAKICDLVSQGFLAIPKIKLNFNLSVAFKSVSYTHLRAHET